MALTETEVHGAAYVFGFQTADAPVIAGFSCRKADLKYAPEVKVDATNGEGHVEATALSMATKRMITASFTGYISAAFSPGSTGNGFSFSPQGLGTRYFLVDDVSEPRNKGEFVEVTISATSKALVTS